MNAITDVPLSGIYLQRGSISNLVVQMTDINTGLPLPLQAATSLFIDVLYPDNSGWRSFPAELATDGSDGAISYTTANNGTGYSDLNQIGLYQMQGRASIGNVPLPSSYMTDFYVLGNISDQATIPTQYPVLLANDGTYWQIYVTQQGALNILPAPANPNAVSVMYLLSPSGNKWGLVAQRSGNTDAHLVTIRVVGSVPANHQFYTTDDLNKQWVVNVLEQGNTSTS